MRTLKRSWNTEEGRLVCRWVELEEGENAQADSSPPHWVAVGSADFALFEVCGFFAGTLRKAAELQNPQVCATRYTIAA